ncbi:MAG TPA: co-chaperone GroES [Chthoniobacterales bacterium]
MAVHVKPLGDRVLVQPIEEQETKKGGIIIPDTAKEKPQEGKVVALGTGKVNEEGKVIALGTGKIDDNGKKVDFTVKKGDKVLISKYGGTEIKIDNESYLIMREDDILGIIG